MEGQNNLKGSLENKKSRTFVFPMGISTQWQTCIEQELLSTGAGSLTQASHEPTSKKSEI